MARKQVFTLSGSSSGAASTTTLHTALGADLLKWDWFTVDAALVGPTGGTMDVYIQRKVDSDLWADWLHFPQVSAAATVKYSAVSGFGSNGATIVAVAQGTDSAHGTPALAANTFVGGHPGSTVRIVTVTGGGVSVAGTFTVKVTGWQGDK